MAVEIMIAGNSGSGKSTSLRNLDPEKTFIINCGKKPLPFRGGAKNYTVFSKENLNGNLLNSNKFEDLIMIIKYVGEKRPEISTLIIDDWQFAMAQFVISRFADKGFDKFNNLARGIWDTVEFAKSQRDDLTVVFMSHLDTSYNSDGVKETKTKTLGKAIDNMVNLDGLFTTILYSEAHRGEKSMEYMFRTVTNGSDTCKSPMGMFEEEYVDNDLVEVIKTIREYYEG